MVRLLTPVLLACLLGVGLSRPALGCPYCKDAAVESGELEEGDPLREARGYNQSIYLMVGMPYLLLGTLGLLAYRSCRAARKKAGRLSPPPGA
jgi:hypothetical protein